MIAPPPRGENKFKAFFRPRSRSRPRPHPQHSPAPSDPMSSYSQPHRTHTDIVDGPPSSYPKSSVRSQNRPISSTTTATHSTITPLPSDTRMNGARHAYAFQPQSFHSNASLTDIDHGNRTSAHDPHDHLFPRTETPPSSKRLLLHSLFGISLTRRSSSSTPKQSSSTSVRKGSTSTATSDPPTKSSRKRSFRLTSRPTTPKSVEEPSSKSPFSIPVPSNPLPLSASPRRRSFGLGGSQRSTPKSSSNHLPLPHIQLSQGGRSHARRHSVGSERPPHDSAVALSEESLHQSVQKCAPVPPVSGIRIKGKERERLFADSQRPLPDFRPSTGFPSQSLPTDPYPISHIPSSSHSVGLSMFSHLPTVESASSEENEHSPFLAPHPLLAIPRIIHTPPTPQRLGEQSAPPPPIGSPAVDSCKVEIAKPKAVTIAQREQVLVSTSLLHMGPQYTVSPRGRFTPRIFGGKDLPKIKNSNGQQSRGRPSARSSDGSIHKTPGPSVAGPVRNMTSHRSKLGSFDFERPVSALNRSSSTIDRHGHHLSRDSSPYSKARLHALEQSISEDSTQGGKSRSTAHHPGQADLPPIKPVHTGDTSVISFSSVSVQTMSTGKGIGSSTPAGQSSSWGRASGRRVLRTSHGTFAFEHPFSAPNSPNPQNSNLPVTPNQNEGQPGVPQPQPRAPLRTIAKHSRGQSYNTPEPVGPGYSKRGDRKFKGKGRSLDLGLGLSWAPSRVREEVLIPGSILAREKAKLEKSKATGSGVTKVFESILSESQFWTFKEYVHRFDAHTIPLEGPSGLLALVEKLLAESGLSEQEREKLMSDFNIFVEHHSGWCH